MIRKFKILMLFALTLYLLGCRTELSDIDVSSVQSSSGSRKVIPLKEALVFKNYLAEVKNNASPIYSKNEDLFSSLSDDATVSVITAQNVISYSTVIRHLDRSSDVLVYSVDNENKSIGLIAHYIPTDRTKNYHIDNFTGTVEYTTMDGKPMGTKELSNGVPLASKKTVENVTSKVDCSYSINLIEVSCNGANHSPDQYSICTADQKPYYIIEISEYCPASGQSQFPNLGLYDGGGGDGSGGPEVTNEFSIEDALNYTLNESGFPELSPEEYTYIQNNQYLGGQLLGAFYNNLDSNKEQFLHWAIGYLKDQASSGASQYSIWKQFQPILDFTQQFLVNNSDVSWGQFKNWFIKPDGTLKISFNTSASNDSMIFNNMVDFKNYIVSFKNSITNDGFDLENGPNETKVTKFKAKFAMAIPVYINVHATSKLENPNTTATEFELLEVSSFKSGITPFLTWNQDSYDHSINGTNVNVNLNGHFDIGVKVGDFDVTYADGYIFHAVYNSVNGTAISFTGNSE